MGGEQLCHPRIVVDAVDDDDLRLGERLGGRGAGFEQMGVVVGAGEDAGHRHVGAADLGGDVAVEVLRRDDFDGTGKRGT